MEVSLRTCHNNTDGWYFRMPEHWNGVVRAGRSAADDAASVTFRLRDGDQPLLRITAYSGPDREVRAMRGSQFLLSRQGETLYAAELLEANQTWEYGVSADQIREAFFLITEEWTDGTH